MIRSCDTSTWKQAGEPQTGHDNDTDHIALNPAGTLLVSTSDDHTVCLWHLITGIAVAQYKHSDLVRCVAVSADRYPISNGFRHKKVFQWEIPEDVLVAASDDLLVGK